MPFSEPWRTTALRTGSIALGIGLGAGLYQRRLAVVPIVTLLALWFTLGGHVVELLFRNGLGRRLGGSTGRQALARLVYWFVGGSVLYAGVLATSRILTGHGSVPRPWWTGGALFVAAELLIHLLMRARQQPSFYDGRG
ncbi:MAG TPA: hypothetical protein VIW26_06480 [Gemmatimonadales bacterium]|jgi:hypothetical protein